MAGTHKELIQVTQDELTKLEGKETPKCKYCGKSIWYETTKVSFRQDGKLASEVGGTTWKTSKTIDGVKYSICVCQHCLEKMYPDFVDRNKKKIFNTFNKYVQYAFEIPQDVIDKKNKLCCPTLENCIRKYGEEKGREVFEEYKRKQAYSNTFEYKQEKHGWTKEQFDEFNKSRAVTLENLINKHGKEEGERIWKEYCERQSYTSTTKYLVEKFGEERARHINLLKARELDGFIEVYGEEKGREIYEEYIRSTNDRNTYSNFSKDFFDELSNELKKNDVNVTLFYADGEHWRYSKSNTLYFLDLFIPEIKYVVEINGDYWHCNPKMYDEDYEHQLIKLTAKEIWERDKIKQNAITNEFGYDLDVIWESEIRKDRNVVIFNLVKKIKNKFNDVSTD